MFELALWAWLWWAGGNLALMLLAPTVVGVRAGVWTNGLKIFVTDSMRLHLTPEQLEAVIAHERGHIVKLHAWRNWLRRCLFLRHSRERLERQELEADDYAAAHADPLALAAALRILSVHSFDLYRAARLEMGYAQPSV